MCRKHLIGRSNVVPAAQILMSDQIRKHVAEGDKVGGECSQFLFGQAFGKLACNCGKIKEIGAISHNGPHVRVFYMI